MQLTSATRPFEAVKRQKKKEKSYCRHSHSKSLLKSPKRSRQEGGEPSTPLVDGLMSKDMRVFEKIKFHISNEEKTAFCNSIPEELVDTMVEFAGLATRLWLKCQSTSLPPKLIS